MRHLGPHLARRLVLAQPIVDDLAQQIVIGPGQKLDLGEQADPDRRLEHDPVVGGSRRAAIQRGPLTRARDRGRG